MKEKEYNELKTRLVNTMLEVTELIRKNEKSSLNLTSIRNELRRFMVFFQELEAIAQDKDNTVESELERNSESVSIIIEYLDELDSSL